MIFDTLVKSLAKNVVVETQKIEYKTLFKFFIVAKQIVGTKSSCYFKAVQLFYNRIYAYLDLLQNSFCFRIDSTVSCINKLRIFWVSYSWLISSYRRGRNGEWKIASSCWVGSKEICLIKYYFSNWWHHCSSLETSEFLSNYCKLQ